MHDTDMRIVEDDMIGTVIRIG